MARRLDNNIWEEHIKTFDSYNGSITVREYCIENNLSISQFYYHKKRLQSKQLQNTQPVFHAIQLGKQDILEENKSDSKEVKITVGNMSVIIPISETELISMIIRELATKC